MQVHKQLAVGSFIHKLSYNSYNASFFQRPYRYRTPIGRCGYESLFWKLSFSLNQISEIISSIFLVFHLISNRMNETNKIMAVLPFCNVQIQLWFKNESQNFKNEWIIYNN